MNDATETAPAQPRNPVEELERLVLISHQVGALIAQSSTFTATGLSIPAFLMLAASEANPGVKASGLVRRAGLTAGAEAKAAQKALVSEGLISETPLPDSKQPAVTITAKGTERLATLRAALAETLAPLPVELWRPVKNTARLVKALKPALPATPAAA